MEPIPFLTLQMVPRPLNHPTQPSTRPRMELAMVPTHRPTPIPLDQLTLTHTPQLPKAPFNKKHPQISVVQNPIPVSTLLLTTT